MVTLDYPDKVEIGVVAFYVPLMLAAFFIAYRHGFGRNSGWLYLVIFTIVRIAGAGLELATIHWPDSSDLIRGYITLTGIGLSPLFLSTLGILGHCLDRVYVNDGKPVINRLMLRIIQIIIIIALVLVVVGIIKETSGTSGSSTMSGATSSTELKAGIILFIISYIAIVGTVSVLAVYDFHQITGGHRQLFIAVCFSLAPLLVRVVYSSISYLGSDLNFNILTGDETYYLCMALLMELVVVFMYEIAGLSLGRDEIRGMKDRIASHDIETQYGRAQPTQQFYTPPALSNGNYISADSDGVK